MNLHRRTLTLTALSALTVFAGCAAKPPEPIVIENTQTVSATVEAIDPGTRLVTLAGPDGHPETVQVSDDVRNLAQVKPGDRVVVRYYESLAAAFKKKGESTTEGAVEQTAGAIRAPDGQRPAGALGQIVTATVTIHSVDRSTHTVMFVGPGGTMRVVAVKDPAAQKFIQDLKSGDEVELTFTEALAISVEPRN